MEPIGWLIVLGSAGFVINIIQKHKNRSNMRFRFRDGLSESDFEVMVRRAGKTIRRIKTISVDGPKVYCEVRSQSGITDWSFELDFNDHGHITGKYRVKTGNDDSIIPNRLGDMISSDIQIYFSHN